MIIHDFKMHVDNWRGYVEFALKPDSPTYEMPHLTFLIGYGHALLAISKIDFDGYLYDLIHRLCLKLYMVLENERIDPLYISNWVDNLDSGEEGVSHGN